MFAVIFVYERDSNLIYQETERIDLSKKIDPFCLMQGDWQKMKWLYCFRDEKKVIPHQLTNPSEF